MTDRIYQHDSYQRECDATVTDVTADGVVLDRTVFFPTGGGVLGDQGTFSSASGASYTVVETLDLDGNLVHRLDAEGLKPGDAVHAELDWNRRYTLMRYHTATHVLAGMIFKDHDVRVTGNQLTPEKGRVDFSFTTFDRAVLEAGFEKSNQLIAQDLPVRINFIPAAEAESRPELFKLETAFRHRLDELRLVEIVDFDTQADGGCHVASLREIGQIVLTKTENKGKANRRVYFVLEDPATEPA